MSVVTGALGSVVSKLAQLLHGEYKLQKGVRKQVEWLQSELLNIGPFLHKISNVPWNQLDKQVKVWAREVREASYDVEDILDTYLVGIDGGEPTDPSRLKRAMKKMGKVFKDIKDRHDIAGAIKDIKNHLEEIAERRKRYRIDEKIAAVPTIDPRLPAMYKEVSGIIGVDKSRDELISMLNLTQPEDEEPDKNITKKVSIVGVGGLGKTTLANVVYEKMKSRFDCAAFVSVGRDLDEVKVFKQILFELNKEKYANIHNDGRDVKLLIDEVRECLKNKSYFIVVDDVWEVKKWKTIELAFVENNFGSKVLTTTRNVDVAKASGEVYKLKPLSYDASMNLFCTRIYGADRKWLDNPRDEILEKILLKCAGIPLAITTMGSLFAGKEKHQWSTLFNSIGFVHDEGSSEVEDTMTILSFSYYDLPPDLKTCLLYLNTYPEDYVIEKDSLIWKWIAEGFIIEKEGTTLFELGERYFNNLINRSLIQVVEAWDGRVSGCCIHDMVLDMIRMLALEENFLAVLRDNPIVTCASSNIRRLAHRNGRVGHKNPEATVTDMTKIRSYNVFLCSIHNLHLFLRFKILRVLDIVYCIFENDYHLDHIGDLVNLRYLGIRKCGIRGLEDVDIVLVLPKQVGNLKLLQTIDVDGVLPESIVQLTKLLRLHGKLEYTQDGIGNLTSLQELIIIPNASWGIYIPERFLKELGRLVELRVLQFSPLDMKDEGMHRDFVESLRNLKKIKHIDVRCLLEYTDTAMWDEACFVLPQSLSYLEWPFQFAKMPSCIDLSRLPCLSHLSLWVVHMDEHDLRLLAKLPELCYLGLGTKSTVTLSNINAGDGGFFPKLRYFVMDNKTVVQFEQPNEEDASISFHLWNGEDAMPFVSRKSNDSSKAVVPPVVMPNLEVLRFFILLQAIKDNNGDCAGSFGVEYLPSLRELRGWIDCEGVSSAGEVDVALAALEKACKVHPNNPTLRMDKLLSRHLT